MSNIINFKNIMILLGLILVGLVVGLVVRVEQYTDKNINKNITTHEECVYTGSVAGLCYVWDGSKCWTNGRIDGIQCIKDSDQTTIGLLIAGGVVLLTMVVLPIARWIRNRTR